MYWSFKALNSAWYLKDRERASLKGCLKLSYELWLPPWRRPQGGSPRVECSWFCLPAAFQIACSKTLLVKDHNLAEGGYYKEKYSNKMVVNLPSAYQFLLRKQKNLDLSSCIDLGESL